MARDHAEESDDHLREETADGDRPWDEARWRRFLMESDIRAARYAELFETLLNDPKRDAKIANEMGWSTPRESQVDIAAEWGEEFSDSDDEDSSEGDFDPEFLDEIDPNDPDLLAEAEADRKALHAIPAYRTGNRLARHVILALRPFENINDERIASGVEHAMIPGAKIAGGHGIGYEDDAICGNIVCNTIALDHAQKAVIDFTELKDESILPAAVVDGILTRLNDLVSQLETRISELRARVTW